MTIFVLGHKGMLGNCIVRYFKKKKQCVVITEHRWESKEFKQEVGSFKGDFIINCIASLPKHNCSEEERISINYELPIWLIKHSHAKIIFAGTDGEFSGKISSNNFYRYSDATDSDNSYGKYKALLFNTNKFDNRLRFIRCSIIGIETSSANSLLSWFLNLEEGTSVNGFENVLWNGITSLEWSKTAEKLMEDWDCENNGLNLSGNLIQIGSEKISKHDLLVQFKDIFKNNITIQAIKADQAINRCLFQYNKAISINNQLKELKQFYGI